LRRCSASVKPCAFFSGRKPEHPGPAKQPKPLFSGFHLITACGHSGGYSPLRWPKDCPRQESSAGMCAGQRLVDRAGTTDSARTWKP
jgi:hypothetical protein